MALYEFTSSALTEIKVQKYSDLRLREREDIQRVLRDHIEVISPSLMVLAEEFGNWEDSKRRIDLLCLNRDRQLVVIELKRTEDGGHMELQALRYAAMVSTMRFDQAVEAHRSYLKSRGLESDSAEQAIRHFLEIEEDPISIADKVLITLVAADFNREITSTVLWLNAQGLDLTCIRARPHIFEGRILLDIQQVIPLPESADYQIAIREKIIETAVAESRGRDFTRYSVQLPDGEAHTNLPKRRLIFFIVREAIRLGLSPEELKQAVSWRLSRIFVSADGNLTGAQLMATAPSKDPARFFCEDDELFHLNGKTYALTNQWGNRTIEAVVQILSKLQEGHGISYKPLS